MENIIFIRRYLMRISKRIIITCFLLVVLSFTILTAQTGEITKNYLPEQVKIAGTQLLHLHSDISNKDYDLYINLPQGYNDSTKKFPVLFLLDAQWDFTLLQAIYGQQYYDGFVPEMVIVGITWGGDNPNYDQLRAHDFTPTDPASMGAYGNASKFISVISKEIIPFVEKQFRIRQDDRTLVGSSFGGLFSLYALFQNPSIFNRFIFTSPAIQWDNKMIYSLNNSFAGQHKELRAKVFMGIGGYENVKEFQDFTEDLKSKNYKNLELNSIVVSGMGHSGAKAEGYARGIQWVFAPQKILVDPALLKTYAGEYSLNPQTTIKLTEAQGRLVMEAPGNPEFIFEAESNIDFYSTGNFLKIHIEKDNSGNVTGITLLQYGGSAFLKKVK